MKEVNVGPFKSPGLHFQPGQISSDTLAQMQEWAEQTKQGIYCSDSLWAFKTPAARTSFILRWNDQIKRVEEE